MSPPPPQPGTRLRSLDGLRGVAAVVVLVHHLLLLVPSLAAVYFVGAAPPRQGPLAWVLSYTPAHLLWAGTEAVYLFFVLSGVVLVLPVLARPGFGWLAYYPRRAVRIYGPVAAALVLGLLAYLVAPRSNDPASSEWVNRRPNGYPLQAVLSDLTLVDGHSGRISPLWSLQWEVLFSFLLPLFVVLVVVGRRFDLLKAVALLGLCALASSYGNRPLLYLPMFGLGALTASRWDDIGAFVRSCAARWQPFWFGVLVVAVLLTPSRWLLTAVGVSPATAGDQQVLALLGVWLFVVMAGWCPWAVRLLTTPLLQWLGRISFSLYLVHEPLVLSARFLTLSAPLWVTVLVAVPLALATAVLFERWVESRFHRLAKVVGRRVQHRVDTLRAV